MKKIISISTLVFTSVVILALGIIHFIIAPRVDTSMNLVKAHAPWPVSDKAINLHTTLRVADLHADTLLWQRNPAKHYARGQTDLPRLRQGGIALQVFTTVTKSPPDLNYEENTADGDDITALAMAQFWPPRTWGSLLERARFQAARLHQLAAKDPQLYMIRTKKDLEHALHARSQAPDAIAAILGMEGAHPLEGSVSNLDLLYQDGFRIIGLQHFFDNALGGSLHGISNNGLTDFGRTIIKQADQKQMIIDVAHSSPQVVRETLALTTRPIIVSHTGFEGHCSSRRNISDSLIAEITRRGGLIGVGFWEDVICDDSPAGIADAIRYGINTFGEDHIALGSDFDGTVTTHLDASELAAITHALLEQGISPAAIRKVMGENAIRFFLETLPE